MIINKPIFSVPIYLCSETEFHMKIEQKEKQDKQKYEQTYAFKKLSIPYEHKYEKVEWKYDKIIGWIEFYLNGKTIKANYWFIKAKKISINLKNKQFEYRNKIADVSATHIKTNNKIIEDIKLFLLSCQERKYIKCFKNHYIYTTEIFKLLKYTDIKGMVEGRNI